MTIDVNHVERTMALVNETLLALEACSDSCCSKQNPTTTRPPKDPVAARAIAQVS